MKQIQPSDTIQDIVDEMATEGMVLSSTKITGPDGDEYMVVAGSGPAAAFLAEVLERLGAAIDARGGSEVESIRYTVREGGGG